MGFFLRRAVEALLLPIGLSSALVVVGAFTRRRWLVLSGVVILYLFSTGRIGRLLLAPLERSYLPASPLRAPGADAIVVLSGGVVRGVNMAGVQWGESASRYFAGMDLLAAGKARTIVFTSAASDDPSGPNQGAIMRQMALRAGISPERIVLTGGVSNTEDEADRVAAIPCIRSVLLVTSAFHMRRAESLFREKGLEVFPFPTDERSMRASSGGPEMWIPGSFGMRLSDLATKEYYGLLYYNLRRFWRGLSDRGGQRTESLKPACS